MTLFVRNARRSAAIRPISSSPTGTRLCGPPRSVDKPTLACSSRTRGRVERPDAHEREIEMLNDRARDTLKHLANRRAVREREADIRVERGVPDLLTALFERKPDAFFALAHVAADLGV